jgi:hypothetical protein
MDIVVPIFISLLFFLAKFIEMKYINKEVKPLKFMIRDTLIVFVASVSSIFLYGRFQIPIQEFMNVVTNTKTTPMEIHPEIFTDNPGF